MWRVDISDYEAVKSFAHLTWFGYVFRYGLVPTVLLLGYLVSLAVRRMDALNPLWLVFIGVLSSATFGANLFYSPTPWIFIALFVRFGPDISRLMRQRRMGAR